MEHLQKNGMILMIKSWLTKNIICRIKGHRFKAAGSCPYTGRTYEFCEACTYMFPREKLA